MDIKAKAEFLAALKNNNAKQQLSAVLFHISDQPQSKQMAVVLDTLAAEHPINCYRVCVDNRMAEINADWQPITISAAPLIVLFQNDVEVDRVEGADPRKLVDVVQRRFGKGAVSKNDGVLIGVPTKKGEDAINGSAVPLSAKEQLHRRLQGLVRASPVMIFMKGSKEEPFCRFSKQAVAILKSLKVDFDSFDVFSDQTVREGMKEFSQWPTFPQLYVKGDFVGGVDIMNEMLQNGELAQLFASLKTDLDERLRALIKQQQIMVFMKGERRNPYCRFSRQLMELLDHAGVTDFGTFDILQDNEVREGLKKFSDWPTYPQVYVNSQLLGGVDVVKSILDQGGSKALVDEIQAMMAKSE